MFALIAIIFISLLLILVLSRTVSRILMNLFGPLVYKILVWPGVIVHELSHLIGALITLTPVRGFSIIPERSEDGEFILGKVTHDATDNPFKQIIISTFPFFGGAVALWFLARFLIPGFTTTYPIVQLTPASIFPYATQWFSFTYEFITQIDITSGTTWLFLYLTLAISAHLAPSNYDLLYALGGILEVGFIIAVLSLFLSTVGAPISPYVIAWAGYALGRLIVLLAYIVALLIFMTLLADSALIIKWLVSRRN